MKKRPVLLAITSDQHCGSTVGLCPPEGVRLDDGGTYRPHKAQLWLWERWNAYWDVVNATRKSAKADLWALYNGDCYDGAHHGTTQIVSGNPEAQAYVAQRVFGIPRALKPSYQFVVRGTEAHAGVSASNEESLARWLKAERDAGGAWSHWHLRLDIHGVRIDAQHHGRAGSRPWSEGSTAGALAAQIFYEHARRKERHPDLAIRSHRHKFVDSGTGQPTRVLQTPAWQLKTAYAHKVAAESLADIGGVIALIEPDGTVIVMPRLYHAELPKVWKP